MTWSRRHAITLVELLVVMAIIGMLVALTIPAVQIARAAADRTKCTNNLIQIGLALLHYSSRDGTYPPGRVGCDCGKCNTSEGPIGIAGISGFVPLLSYLEQDSAYGQSDLVNLTLPIGSDVWLVRNEKLLALRPPVFVCPSDKSQPSVPAASVFGPDTTNVGELATSSYALVHGTMGPSFDQEPGGNPLARCKNDGMFVYRRQFSSHDVKDGLSHTMFVGEAVQADTSWSHNFWALANCHESSLRTTENPLNSPPGEGTTISRNGVPLNGAFGSGHPGGGLFLFGDGHIAFLKDEVEKSVYRALSTRAGQETIPETP